MVKAYKGFLTLFLAIGVIGGLYISLSDIESLSLSAMIQNLIFGILWLFACCFALCIFLVWYDNRWQRHLQNCKPRAFIAHGEKVYPHLDRDVFNKNAYSINLFAAYHDLGAFERAEWYLDQVNTDFADNLSGVLTKHGYLYNRCARAIDKGEFEKAEQLLSALDAILASPKLNSYVRETAFLNNQALRYEMQMEMGNYDGAEAFFENRYRVAKTVRECVTAQYLLVRVYRHEGNFPHAREACLFVIANGGETRFVGEAQAMLAALDSAGEAAPL